MTNDLLALADRLEKHINTLANISLPISLLEWDKLANDMLEATAAIRTAYPRAPALDREVVANTASRIMHAHGLSEGNWTAASSIEEVAKEIADSLSAAPVEPEPVGEVEPVAWRVWNRWNCSSIICQEPDPEFWVKIEPLYTAPIPSPAADVERLREALEPFAKVAESDIGSDETDDDYFIPMHVYNRSARLKVGHLRNASKALSSVPSPAPAGLREALLDATAHLVAAASAYRKHASRHRSVGRAETDPFFSTRVADFEKAAGRAQTAIRSLSTNREGEK